MNKLRFFAFALIAISVSCSSPSTPEKAQPTNGEPPITAVPAAEDLKAAGLPITGTYARRFQDPLVQNTYQVAVDVCFYETRKEIASQFGVAADDPNAISDKYSEISREGPHRAASAVGCLEGLMAPGAGQGKQFGR